MTVLAQPWPGGVTASLIADNCQPVGIYQGDLVYRSLTLNRDAWWDVTSTGMAERRRCGL